MSSESKPGLPRELLEALDPETAKAVAEVFPEVQRDPVSMLQQTAPAISMAADFAEANAEAMQSAGVQAFLSSPPNPSDLHRKVAEGKRLKGIWRSDIDQIHESSPNFACNFCGTPLGPELKWALVPLLVAIPPRSTLACLKCTEIAFLARDRDERIQALRKRHRLRKWRELPFVESTVATVVAFVRIFAPPDGWKALVFCGFLGYGLWVNHDKNASSQERDELAAKCSTGTYGMPTRASSMIRDIHHMDRDAARKLATDCRKAERLGLAMDRRVDEYLREHGSTPERGRRAPEAVAREEARRWALEQLRE